MEKNIFYTWLIVNILMHILRSVYERLKAKNKIKLNNVTYIVIFIIMFMLWSSWFAMCEADIYKIEIPVVIKYTGLILVITGVIVFFVSLFTIKTLENYKGKLITKGIYSILRHPMYFGFILWIFGFAVFQSAIVSFSISPIFILNVLYWRRNEEKFLINKYPDYSEYSKKTIF